MKVTKFIRLVKKQHAIEKCLHKYEIFARTTFPFQSTLSVKLSGYAQEALFVADTVHLANASGDDQCWSGVPPTLVCTRPMGTCTARSTLKLSRKKDCEKRQHV